MIDNFNAFNICIHTYIVYALHMQTKHQSTWSSCHEHEQSSSIDSVHSQEQQQQSESIWRKQQNALA